jgi:hypothetical protein
VLRQDTAASVRSPYLLTQCCEENESVESFQWLYDLESWKGFSGFSFHISEPLVAAACCCACNMTVYYFDL